MTRHSGLLQFDKTHISTVYTTQVREHGMLPSTGTVGDSYDNAMAESVNDTYKTELVWRRKPIGDVPVGLVVELEASPPVAGLQDTGTDRNRVSCKPSGTNRLTIKGEQKSGHVGSLIALVMLRCDGLDIHLPQPRT